ncbi:MAG: right-handed parallel beta-helix repeat-containing protein [Planctomycetota bacterium]
MRYPITLLVVSLATAYTLVATPSYAQVVRSVPGDHATIQAGIVAAQNGDIVEVAPGTYVENLDFLGKTIVVRSSGGPNVTTIDGSSAPVGATQRAAIQVRSGEGSGTALQGFTITGGNGNSEGDSVYAAAFYDERGGGVYVRSSSIEIRDCRFIQNLAHIGSAIYCVSCPDVSVIDCELKNNATGFRCVLVAVGGTNFTMRNCQVTDNFSVSAPVGMLIYNVNSTLEDSLFADNSTLPSPGDGGGALYVSALSGQSVPPLATIHVRRCTFRNNDYAGNGASVTVSGFVDSVFEDCVFRDEPGTPASVDEASAIFRRCLFADNVSTSATAVITTVNLNTLVMENCTMTGGTGVQATLVLGGNTATTLRNCIIWGDTTPMPIFQFPGSATQDIQYCDIEGGYPGTGNFDADPLFVNPAGGSYFLASGSPCIDTGDPSFPLDPDGTTIDVGAFPASSVLFKRGDTNLDGAVDVGDAVSLLLSLFGDGGALACDDAGDANDSGALDIADAVFIVSYLFSGGAQPPAPGVSCGTDATTADPLGCEVSSDSC